MHWGLPSWALLAFGSSGLWPRFLFKSVKFKEALSGVDLLA